MIITRYFPRFWDVLERQDLLELVRRDGLNTFLWDELQTFLPLLPFDEIRDCALYLKKSLDDANVISDIITYISNTGYDFHNEHIRALLDEWYRFREQVDDVTRD